MPGCGTVYCDNAFGGEDSDSNIYIGDDYMYTYTLSFSLSFSGSPSFFSDTLALSRSFSFSLCLSFGVFLSHTQRFLQPVFWMWGWVLRGLSQSVGCECLDISWFKTLFLLMFGNVFIYSNTHPLTRSQVYPPSHKCHQPVFVGLKNAEKAHKHLLRHAMTLSLRSNKKSPAAQASGGVVYFAGLTCRSDCSKSVHNYFLKKLYWTRSQLLKTWIPRFYARLWQILGRFQSTTYFIEFIFVETKTIRR